ncbi:MAG: exopolyphosphatase [Burkholderiales bacterium]
MKHDILAALDLGSNSFHLQIGRVVNDQIYLLDGLRDPVQLGAGLTRDRRIDRATQLKALDALSRFSERLRGFPKSAVRAVGTNALRVARNAEQFLAEAQAVLGYPVEVVFGKEEARLIYIGVAHSLPVSFEGRLVVDVGGGSTEFIIGSGLKPELLESVSMGCVSFSLRFFPEGRLDKQNFKNAELAAANEIERFVAPFQRAGWKQAVASSGTARTVASLLHQHGWCERGIDAQGLARLRAAMIRAGEIRALRFPEVREDRLRVLAGGVAILIAVFAELGIEFMDVSDSALRQGVLYDLLGRARHHDPREATVNHFQARYHVDTAQAERVASLAESVHRELAADTAEEDLMVLHWAAALHEIGISIAHAGYHKHSAYILSQADMPGFSQHEQARLSRIVLAHRGKLGKRELEGLAVRSADWQLIFSLRIAALFCRSRNDIRFPRLRVNATELGFQLALPEGWLEEHPMTQAALDEEAQEWGTLGMKVELRAYSDERLRAAG